MEPQIKNQTEPQLKNKIVEVFTECYALLNLTDVQEESPLYQKKCHLKKSIINLLQKLR